MQPLSDLFPRLEMVFHVTKRGYSSSRFPKMYGRREAETEGAEETEETEETEREEWLVEEEDDGVEGVDESVKTLREDAVERVDGVEEFERD